MWFKKICEKKMVLAKISEASIHYHIVTDNNRITGKAVTPISELIGMTPIQEEEYLEILNFKEKK